MQARGYLSVRVVAVHVACGICGDTARIQHDAPDGFTRYVLQPLAGWWTSHRAPKLVLLEVIADGEPQEWAAVG